MKLIKILFSKQLILTIVCLSPLGCGADTVTPSKPKESNVKVFSPLFKGLSPGTIPSKNCISFKTFSVKTTYIDIDYKFELYKGNQCEDKNRTYSGNLPAEAFPAGEWKQLLVVDNGTGGDSRSIKLMEAASGKTIEHIDYAVEPIFYANTIEYYTPTATKPTSKDCKSQNEELKEWINFGIEIGLARKEIYNFSSGTTEKMAEYVCYGIQ